MERKEGNGHGSAAQGSLRELHDHLRGFDTAMLVTITPEGLLRARPMALQVPGKLDDCDLWFVTGDDTAKAIEIGRHAQVCVVCHRPRDSAYVSISASAWLDKDRATIQRLFEPSWRAWFPRGADDPTISLLKLTIERAEYWEPEGGRLRVLYEMVKSMVGREPADRNLNPPKHV